ncbi:uncharacterized protein LOC135497329 isoform X2 [Lineus longissimus]|uniref:uncharacterized protein LOC135497329 isoform X2 n=1 Tax=Lineus longissimus TaxID=88925 RepID=UPI00315D01D9
MDKRDTDSSTRGHSLKGNSRVDSNYGSLEQLGEEGSSSSISLSASFSDSTDEIDTTSISQGSLCMPSDKRRRKRDKIKACLRKLKYLIPSTTESKKESGTVFALRQALSHIKQLQGAADTGAKFSIKIDEIQEIVETKQGASASGTNNCVLAVHQGTILLCSTQLEQLLGYPKDYLCNHSFSALVHHRDEQTVSFSVQGPKSSSDEEAVDEGLAMAEGPREIYFRMQCFKGLRHGFSVTNSEYLTLLATITLATKTVEQKSEFDDAETKKKTYAYYIFNCSEVKPAYKIPMEVPDLAIFSTRHSIYCLYTYMHPSSIRYLGFLPSDIENTSIFNLYHPNDMMHLYNMYEEVIKAGVSATRSKPYRLRVKNNDYIMVETTWSCFVDPWTKKLEFLVGQHKVLQGPQHLDIFSRRSSTGVPDSVEVEYFRKKIKDLFVVAGKSIVAAQKLIENVQAPVLAQPPADDARTLDSNSPLELQAEDDLEDMSGGVTRVTASYNQVSYSQIIRNFLMTCPQTVFDPEIPTISMISKKLLSTTAKGVHYDENTRVPVANLSTVKPPSFCSSTKALLSEPEPMSPNPAKEMDPLDETVPQGGKVYKPKKLTKTALMRHTKTQEQFFLQQMATAEAKELMRMPEPRENIKAGTKRPLESDECQHGTAKRVRGLEPPPAATATSSWDYQPIMEYSEMDFSASQYGNVATGPQDFHHLSCSQRMMGLSQNPPRARLHGGKVTPSHLSLSPDEITDNTFNESLVSVGGGLSSSHYTEGLSDPDISVSSSLFSLPSRIKRIEDEGGCMAKPLYWPGRIMSVPAWLMIQNWNESSIQGYKLPVQDMKTVLLKDSQWLDCSVQSDYVGKQLNTAIGECKAVVNDSEQFFLFEPYQLPMLKDIELSTTSCSSYEMKDKQHQLKHKIKRSRSKNDLKVNKVKLALIKKAKEEKLCAAKPLGLVDGEKCDSGEMSGKCDSGLGTGERSMRNSPSFSEQAKYAKGREADIKECTSVEKPPKSVSPNTESKCETESNSSNNDRESTASGNDHDSSCGNDQDSNTSSNERDLNDPDRSSSPSNSKGEGDSDISSGITPSDQRSTGEVNSSLKESDGVSSKESGSTHSNSDCKPSKNSTLTQSDDDAFMSFFNRLFVPSVERKRPMPQYPSTNTKVNPWLEDVGLNKELEMEYTMESKQLGDVLNENNRLTSKIEQSEMVRLQLDEFLEDVMKVGQGNLCEEHGSQEKTYSELLDMLNPSRVDTKESYWTDMTKAMEIEGDLLTQADQSMTIVMSNKHKESDQDMMGSKSSSSGSQNQSSNSSNKLLAVPHEKRSVCSKSTNDSGLGSSMISSSKDSASASGHDKESSCSFKRSDEESSDTGRGKDSTQTSSKGSDGDGDASMHCA